MKEKSNNPDLFVMSITPDYARRILEEKNKRNRPINMRVVDHYVSMMKRGQWLPNGETIKFDRDGNLIDGQHRLKAVSKSNMTIDFYVVTNLDPMTYGTIDQGRPRTIRDFFQHEGVLNYSRVAPLVRRYMQMILTTRPATCNASSREMKISSQDILDMYRQHADAFQDIARYSIALTGCMYLFPPIQIGGIIALLIIHLGYDEETVYKFMNMLFQYKTNEDFSSCRLLRERIAKSSLKKEILDARYKQNLLIRAWEYYLNGYEAKTLKVKSEEGDLSFKPANQTI